MQRAVRSPEVRFRSKRRETRLEHFLSATISKADIATSRGINSRPLTPRIALGVERPGLQSAKYYRSLCVSAAADHAGAGNMSGSLSFTIWRTPSASTISMLMSPSPPLST
jgi:hypothetical protein